MKKILTIKNLFLLIIFCTPLYLIKICVFDVPSNIFELFSMFAIAIVFIKEKKKLLRCLLNLPKKILLSCGLILFGVVTSILFSIYNATGYGILKSWFVVPLFFSFALYLILDSTDFLEKIYLSIFLSALIVGLVAIGYKLLGITTYDSRLSAFYLSPNYLAMYLVAGLFFGLYFLQKDLSRNIFFKKIYPYFVPLFLIIIPLYFTFSYGTWLAALGSILITLLITIKNKRNHFFSLLFFCSIFLFFSQSGSQKFSDIINNFPRSSISSRIMIWKSSLLMLKNNPVFGIGPGNFQNTYLSYQKYFPPYLEWAVPEPHDLYLAFWLQTGFIGLIGFLLLFGFVFNSLWHLLQNKKSAALAAPLFGFFLYTAMHGIIDTPFWKNDLAFLFWICVFLTVFLQKYFQKNNSHIINSCHNS